MAEVRTLTSLPRLPHDGRIGVIYCCGATFSHCSPWESDDETERACVPNADDWRAVVRRVSVLRTRRWSVSGDVHMRRNYLAGLSDCVTTKAIGYSPKTNRMLTASGIAWLMKREGNKMATLLGETANSTTVQSATRAASWHASRVWRGVGVDPLPWTGQRLGRGPLAGRACGR